MFSGFNSLHNLLWDISRHRNSKGVFLTPVNVWFEKIFETSQRWSNCLPVHLFRQIHTIFSNLPPTPIKNLLLFCMFFGVLVHHTLWSGKRKHEMIQNDIWKINGCTLLAQMAKNDIRMTAWSELLQLVPTGQNWSQDDIYH